MGRPVKDRTMIRYPTHPAHADLEREIEILEQRLRDGERRIDEATRIGTDIEAWEEFWIELLHTYEAVYRRMDALDNDPDAMAA
jgi:hypothetical protein